MFIHSHETAPTRQINAGGITFAYRRFGKRGGVPLLLLNYFAANMDDWDPKITNGLAAEHDVIIFDYPGIGKSSGKTPAGVEALTRQCVDFFRALGFKQVDVMGFSLGGMISQQLAYEYPDLIRRVILLGTGPRGGEDMTFTELSAEEQEDPIALLTVAFFTTSEKSKAAARDYIQRLQLRTADRDDPVSKESATIELGSIREWGTIPPTGRYAMLADIHQPTLIVHGAKDIVVTPINAYILAQHIPNAQLVMYPDASHGAQSQYAENFLKQANIFLTEA
ncbi:alpha/beta fold hydrolase [Dyella flava]|nr:alpha/beta hydrolase [Dyella flava]GLQ50953.1 alpha/beta hydrolase [Dyella flava]